MRIILTLLLILMATPSWATLAWRNGTGANTLLGSSNASDIDTNTQNNIVFPLDSLLSNYRKGMALVYDSAAQITVSLGEVTVSNSDGSIRLMLHNTTNTTVTWADIDTGAEASGTTYYIYAVGASASATTATFKISASSTAPSGVTYYKKLGSFYNNSSSDIDQNKIYTEPYGFAMTDSTGLVTGAVGGVLDYGTSTSTSTRRNIATYYFAHGVGTDPFSITNLPYTSSSTYTVQCTIQNSGIQTQNIQATAKSASGFTCSDGLGNGNNIEWDTFGY